MLRASALNCMRGSRTVLSGITLDLPAGEVLGVLGANGAGKTTLLATLAGELAPGGGQLQIGWQAVARMKPGELARCRAVLPQSASLAFDLEVHAIVGMGSYPFPELSPSDLRALVDEALGIADASGFAGRRYATLSGGEQQRVQFARVLVQLLAARPSGQYRALFLDEPIASLDPKHQIGLLQAVRSMARVRGIAALVVLHDVNLAAAWCDRLLLLGGGGSIALDTPASALTTANLERAYDTPASVMPHPLRPAQPLVLFG